MRGEAFQGLMLGGGWSQASPDAHSIMTHAGISVAAHSGLNNTKMKRSVLNQRGWGIKLHDPQQVGV